LSPAHPYTFFLPLLAVLWAWVAYQRFSWFGFTIART
jgi:hypothetical protein